MSTDNQNHNRVAGGTITWGVILLVIAAIAFAIVMFDISTITPAVIGWSVVGLGGLLVVAAIVGVVARAVRPAERVSTGPVQTGSTTGPVSTGSTSADGDQPIG